MRPGDNEEMELPLDEFTARLNDTLLKNPQKFAKIGKRTLADPKAINLTPLEEQALEIGVPETLLQLERTTYASNESLKATTGPVMMHNLIHGLGNLDSPIMDQGILSVLRDFDFRKSTPISDELNKVRGFLKSNLPLKTLVKQELERASSQNPLKLEREESALSFQPLKDEPPFYEYREESLSCQEEMVPREASSQRSHEGMGEDEDVLMKEEVAEVDQKVDFSQFIGQGDADPGMLVAMQDYLDQQHNRKTPRRYPGNSKGKLYYRNQATASKTPRKRVYEPSDEEIPLRPISDAADSQGDSPIQLQEEPEPLPMEPLKRDFSEIYNDMDPDLLKEGGIQRIEGDEELMIIEPTRLSMAPQFTRVGMSTMDRGTNLPQVNYMDSRVNAYEANRKRRGIMAAQTPFY